MPEQGSIIVVVATDAPLLPHQLKRIATRVSLGIGRQGGFGGNSSGDIFVAFSTANARAWFNDQPVTDVKMLPNDRISPLFQATAQATEAAITNALLAAETTTGANDLRDLRAAGGPDAGGDEEVRPAALAAPVESALGGDLVILERPAREATRDLGRKVGDWKLFTRRDPRSQGARPVLVGNFEGDLPECRPRCRRDAETAT